MGPQAQKGSKPTRGSREVNGCKLPCQFP
jgi:hypothetical protein